MSGQEGRSRRARSRRARSCRSSRRGYRRACSAAAPGREDLALELRERLAGARPCASARRGARRACRGPSTAGRRARGRTARRRRARPRPVVARRRSSRPCARPCARSASARPGCRSTATISPSSPISAARWVVLPPGAAHRSSTRSPGLRARARGRRPSRRATAACSSPSSHSGARERVERRRRGSAPRGGRGDSVGRAGARRARRAVVRSVLARSDGLGGLVVGRHQRARGLGRRSVSHHSSRDPLGVRVRQRGLRRAWRPGSAATSGRASRVGAAQDGVDEAGAARARRALASSTDSPTAACGGDAIEKGQLEDPEPQRGEDRRVELRGVPARSGARSRGRASRRAGRCRSSAAWPAPRSRASSPSRALRRAARGRPRRPARTRGARRRTRTHARGRRLGSRPDGRSSFCMAAFTTSLDL